jgi:hypothetical protein
VIAHCPARAHYSFSDLRSLAATSVHFRAMLCILGPYWIAVNQNLGGTCVQQPSSSNSGRACIHISHYHTELQQCSQSFISAVAAAADCAFPEQLKVWAFAACDPAELSESVPQGVEALEAKAKHPEARTAEDSKHLNRLFSSDGTGKDAAAAGAYTTVDY